MRQERNDARMVRSFCIVSHEDKISVVEISSRLKLKSMRPCSQDRRLQWFGHLERIEECLVK